jgi:hypothetical protein
MKTTSFQISKKLAEIGFKAEHNIMVHIVTEECFFNIKEIKEHDYISEYYPSYDLETILDALPKEIGLNNHHNTLFLDFRPTLLYSRLSVINYCFINHADVYKTDHFKDKTLARIEQLPKESLADMAARMLILLVEKGIINFKQDEKK